MKTPHPDEVDIEFSKRGYAIKHVSLNQYFTSGGDLTSDYSKRAVFETVKAADRARAVVCSTFWRE